MTKKILLNDRLRALGFGAALLLVGLALLQLTAVFLVHPQLAQIERTNVEQNTTRAVDAVTAELSRMQTTSTDWATWDDTYAFIQDLNPAYAASNLTNESIQNLGLDFILYARPNGQIVYQAGIDENAEAAKAPADLLAAFSKDSHLLAPDIDTTHQGIIKLADGPLIFSARPILNSQGEGPVRGTLVFARYFDKDLQKQITATTQLNVHFYGADEPQLPEDVLGIAASLSGTRPGIKILSNNTVAGYRILQDTANNPALIVKVESSRDLFLRADRSLRYYLVVATIIVLFLTIVNGETIVRLLNKQRAIELKDEFFSIASHELRTPLTAIKGNSQLIEQMYGQDNPDLKEMAGDIHSSSERLIGIVNNFLDAARLEQGRLTFKWEVFSAQELIAGMQEELHGAVLDKPLKIKVELPPGLPAIYADRDKLKQIIYNLVGNAIKYTDQGSITLRARLSDKNIIISVQDTGRGIPKESQEALFGKFSQVKSSDSKKGTGLGLYISRMLVAQMSGTIWVESSELDKGTTISFSLPVANA